jgi:hypothetical protein
LIKLKKTFVPKLPRFSIRKKVSSFVFSFSSIVALAAINYTIIHSPIVFAAIFVLLTHELGHYIWAKRYTKDVNFPIFVPLPILLVGFTRVKNLSDIQKSEVALAGPIFGSIAAFLLIIFNFVFRLFSPALLFALLISEIVFNYFGMDGIKYRKYRKTNTLCTY